MEDALYAQLLSMGFDISLIERYRLVMASSDTPRDLTAATEWYAGTLQYHVLHHPHCIARRAVGIGGKKRSGTVRISLAPPCLVNCSGLLCLYFASRRCRLLEHAARQPGQATPTSAHVEDVQQPMSSTKDLSSSSAEGSGPLHSRYAMSERQARDKQRYQSKEREEVVRKARETKAAEQKVRNL